MFNSSSSLFPDLLDNQSSPTLTNSSTDEVREQLLWNNMNTFNIPDDNHVSLYSSSLRLEKESSVFNISWGGNDKAPLDIHPEKSLDEPIKLSRPLPKPRGIRKLPEPAPAPDGTIDEDTLKRRKNTDAARRSRMKKILKVDQLESKVNSLQAENAKLVLNNAVLESEKKSLYAKEKEYQKRIKYLEDIIISRGLDAAL